MPTSTRPGRRKRGPPEGTARRDLRRARRPRPRTLPRRADQQNPPRGRAGAKALVRRDHGRAAGRFPAVRNGPRSHPGAEAGARQAAQAAGPGAGRQGVRLPRQPLLPAQTRDQGHHPGSGGPGPQPPQARLARWAAAEVRQGRLQAAARGRVRDQPAQTPPGRRHSLRQTRRPLRSDRAGRRHQRVAVTSTFTTDPRASRLDQAGLADPA
ncbi:hypothetical protein SGPA1_11161 [Streptomyces misionensis JCM 4497]